MKRVLLKSIIIFVVLHFAFAVNIRSDGFGKSNLQKATENFGATNRSSGIGFGDPNNPTGDPNKNGDIPISGTREDLPVGAGGEILGSLGLVYGFYLFLRRRREEN